jgi:hypothetical protein
LLAEESEMINRRKHPRIHGAQKKAVRVVKQRLIALISVLSTLVLIFAFRLGETLWLAWMIEYRPRILGLLLLILICMIVVSPLIMEYTEKPRALSGPGKNPYIDP